jgi:hypothetical protein
MSKRSRDYIYRAKRADKNKRNRKGGGVRKEMKIKMIGTDKTIKKGGKGKERKEERDW